MTVKMAADSAQIEAEHGTELKLLWCFQRRGLALDQTSLISWDKHEAWVATLFQAYASDPPTVFLKGSIRADREMFTLLARECPSIQQAADGSRPLDETISKLRTDLRVSMYLLPLPHMPGKVASGISASHGDSGQGSNHKGVAVSETKEVKLPDDAKTTDGKPICWAFNMDGCSAKCYGNPVRCVKGVHLCAFCRKPGHAAKVA